MIHTKVYNQFKKEMPSYAEKVVYWWPNGYDSIRIRLYTNEEFIFSIDSDGRIIFESMDSFLIRLKGGSAMKC